VSISDAVPYRVALVFSCNRAGEAICSGQRATPLLFEPCVFLERIPNMNDQMSRRAAMAGIAAITPALSAGVVLSAAAVAAEADSFLAALAKFHECDAAFGASQFWTEEDARRMTEEEYWAPQRNRHEALFAAAAVVPTTSEGWAQKLEFLTKGPTGSETYPLIAQGGNPADEWRQAICGTLRSAEAMCQYGKA
jgi:hypothetical protein